MPRSVSPSTPPAVSSLEEAALATLTLLGEDPKRSGLLRTPQRVAKSLQYLTKGYHENLETIINGAIFEEEDNAMVLVKEIEMYSLCEHHLLPFFGKAHIAYIPTGKIIGISKIPRIVDLFARRLQVQERLTTEIANTLNDILHPMGVAVVIEAKHLCMMMRGVEKQNSEMVTSCMLGIFRRRPESRAEFLSLIGRRSSSIL